jgi:putative methyltransferase
MKKSLYLLELSDIFANQVYLPYSSGVVASYAFSREEIKNTYELKDWFYYRQPAKDILKKIDSPSVVGFACFIWNWNLNLKIAKELKSKYPDCLIVFGGQQQPLADRVGNFFIDHPYVDMLVHGEGEESFVEILLENSKDNPDFSKIAGITYNDKKSGKTTQPRIRIKSIEDFDSPYLDGLFDKLIEKNEANLQFSAIVESARGCPFQCTFCEIGEKYYQKVYKNYIKIRKEIDWIADHKIEYITDANSNYGMYYELDKDLSQYVKEKKEETGYPHAYRVTWVKGKADRVLEIAKILEEAKAQKGMTIALQSMSPKVLKAIKRKNVDGGKLREFVEMYEGENISSYVELIWGLPEETLESFIDGVCEIMEMDYHNYLDIHLMTALINTPFSRPDYISKYGIETSITQPRFHHRHISNELSEDTSKFVTKADTFTKEEWMEGHQFRWLVIFGHYLGPTQFVSRFLRKHCDLSYKDFYSSLLSHIKSDKESFLGKEYYSIIENMEKILKNERHWGIVVPEISEINWSVDEATAIKVAMNYEAYEDELRFFLKNGLGVSLEDNLLKDLLEYQKLRLNHPGPENYQGNFEYNIHDVIENEMKLQKQSQVLEFQSSGIKNHYEWAKKIIWHGRRTGDYKSRVK